MMSSLHPKGGRPGNLLSTTSFSCLTVRYDRPSLSTIFKDKLVVSNQINQIRRRRTRTSPIASRSITADNVGPRIFAQFATCQSHWETKGAQTDCAAVSSVDPRAALGIGAPALSDGKRSITTVGDFSALGMSKLKVCSIGMSGSSSVVSTAC